MDGWRLTRKTLTLSESQLALSALAAHNAA
jgi:hypothetical protein